MRDLRDPHKLGEELLKHAKPGRRLSQAYALYSDTLEHPMFPVASKDDSMGKQCVREYRAELEARAAAGDIYAASAIESIDSGQGVQGYDDAGS